MIQIFNNVSLKLEGAVHPFVYLFVFVCLFVYLVLNILDNIY